MSNKNLHRLALLLMLLIAGMTSVYGQSIETKFYGTWTCSYKSNNGDVRNNVAWTFEEEGKGYFTNYSDSSNKNGITCSTKLPFEWAVNKKNQILYCKWERLIVHASRL